MNLSKKIFCRYYQNIHGGYGFYFTDECPDENKRHEIEGFDCWVGDWEEQIIQETNVQEK